MLRQKILILFAILYFTGCSSKQPNIFDATNSFKPLIVDGKIPIKTALKKELSNTRLVVVIEGDGHAWLDRHTPSNDPTPKNAVGQKIALGINASSVLYVARPCQYLTTKEREICSTIDWTDGRFSQKLLLLINDAITKVKTDNGFKEIVLVGYSGGGTMAMLLGAVRDDVKQITTVASPLNTTAWTTFHNISPLKNSLNPADEKQKLFSIKQRHFIGTKDSVVPINLTKDFVSTYPKNADVKVIELQDLRHDMKGFELKQLHP